MRAIAAIFACAGLMQAAAADGIVKERVFGPETQTGRYKHPASITELANGDMYLAWYGGDGEYKPGTAVYASRLPKGSSRWTTPKPIAHDPFYSVGNPVVWQAPDGLVWFWYVIRPGATWSTSRIAVKVSKDGANTWSDSSVFSFEEGTMVRGKPIVLANGDYLLPVWKETGGDIEVVGADTASFFFRRDHRSGQWTGTNRINGPQGALQPAVAEVSSDELVAFCRRGGGYGPESKGYIVRTESHDGGRIWSEGKDTTFPNPNAAVDLLRLRNGHLLLIYNDSMTDRTPLATALSTDGGKTFVRGRDIATGPYDYAYPYVIETKDGKIHLVYTSHGRTVINHAVFEERDVAPQP
jgi:predicted neuraminidase